MHIVITLMFPWSVTGRSTAPAGVMSLLEISCRTQECRKRHKAEKQPAANAQINRNGHFSANNKANAEH